MKKKLILSFVFFAVSGLIAKLHSRGEGAQSDFQKLYEEVRVRSSQMGEALLDAKRECCRADALAERVYDLADNTRLFVQELLSSEQDKGRKKALSSDVAKITKKIIPEIMKIQRSLDRVERSLEKYTKAANKQRALFREDYLRLEQQGVTDLSRKDPDFSKMIKHGKFFRKYLDSALASKKEVLDFQRELVDLRSSVLSIEGVYVREYKKFIKNAKSKRVGEPWTLSDWVNSMFGQKPVTEGPSVTSDSMRQQGQKGEGVLWDDPAIIRQKMEKMDMDFDSIDVNFDNIDVNFDGHGSYSPERGSTIGELEDQIRALGTSIQQLSASIDSQLEELENLTKNIVQETLSKVEL